jgi:hypothetical protein
MKLEKAEVARAGKFAARIYQNYFVANHVCEEERELILTLLAKMHHPDADIVYCDHCPGRAIPPTSLPEED